MCLLVSGGNSDDDGNLLRGGRMKFNCTPNKAGQLVIDEFVSYKAYVHKNIGKRMTLDLKPYKRAKTPEQNGYFHGVVVPFIAIQMGHDPHLRPEYNMVREALKAECGMRSKIAYGGQERLIIKSIADYTIEDYTRLIEACGVLCENLYNCRPPAPETDKAKDMIDEYGTMR